MVWGVSALMIFQTPRWSVGEFGMARGVIGLTIQHASNKTELVYTSGACPRPE